MHEMSKNIAYTLDENGLPIIDHGQSLANRKKALDEEEVQNQLAKHMKTVASTAKSTVDLAAKQSTPRKEKANRPRGRPPGKSSKSSSRASSSASRVSTRSAK